MLTSVSVKEIDDAIEYNMLIDGEKVMTIASINSGTHIMHNKRVIVTVVSTAHNLVIVTDAAKELSVGWVFNLSDKYILHVDTVRIDKVTGLPPDLDSLLPNLEWILGVTEPIAINLSMEEV